MSECVCVAVVRELSVRVTDSLHAAPLDLAAVSAAKEEQRQKPLPSTPVKQGGAPPASPKTPAPAAASASPFRRVMGFFGSSPKVTRTDDHTILCRHIRTKFVS